MCNPLVSIFLPYYNDKEFLRFSIESVLNSTYGNIELILLNHATTDNCREIPHSYKDSRIIHLDVEKNYGAGGGILFEKMLNVSHGEYIKPVCADDVLKKDGIEKLVNFLENNKNIDFCFGNVEYINYKGHSMKETWFNSRPFFSLHNSEADCIRMLSEGKSFLPWAGAFFRKKIFSNILIEKAFVMTFDMYIEAILLCRGNKLAYLSEVVSDYRIHSNQISAIENSKKAGTFSFFEFKYYWHAFLQIQDVQLAKDVWPNNKLVSYLKDKKDIPFFVAYSLFIKDCLYGNSSELLYSIFNNKEQTEHVEKIFQYSIKEFREDILKLVPKDNDISLCPNNSDLDSMIFNFKRRIYEKSSKRLNIFEIVFLFIRKIYHILYNFITFKFKRKTKKKKFSL